MSEEINVVFWVNVHSLRTLEVVLILKCPVKVEVTM